MTPGANKQAENRRGTLPWCFQGEHVQQQGMKRRRRSEEETGAARAHPHSKGWSGFKARGRFPLRCRCYLRGWAPSRTSRLSKQEPRHHWDPPGCSGAASPPASAPQLRPEPLPMGASPWAPPARLGRGPGAGAEAVFLAFDSSICQNVQIRLLGSRFGQRQLQTLPAETAGTRRKRRFLALS